MKRVILSITLIWLAFVSSGQVSGVGVIPLGVYVGQQSTPEVPVDTTYLTTLPDGLVGAWELNEISGITAYYSITGYDGTNTNITVNQTGVSGSAYQFDGNGVVDIGDYDEYSFTDGVGNDTPFTISLWINPDVVTANKGLVVKSTSTSYEWFLIIRGSSSKLLTRLYTNSTNSIDRESNTALTTTNGWYHVVVTYDGSESNTGINYYIDTVSDNGTLGSSGTYTGMPNGLRQLTFGEWNNANYYDGLMDQVAIWSRVLTSSEISELYNSGAGLPVSGW